jgi:serine/threonine protein kinase
MSPSAPLLDVDEQRLAQALEIFRAILEAPVTERSALLTKRCGEDNQLRAEVEELLAADQASAVQRFLTPEDTPANGASTDNVVPSDPTEKSPLVGQTLQGPQAYQIRKAYAKGGMGEVFVAEDEHLGRTVAFKRLQEKYAHSGPHRQRFLNEAKITAKLQHPGIVPIYGVTTDADGQPSYAMRFIEGESLAEAIQQWHSTPQSYEALPFRQLLQRFVSVCQTMAFAHNQQIIHRDLKPANIMLGSFGETLVVDWGLAKEVVQGPGSMDREAAKQQSPMVDFTRTSPDDRVYTQAGQVLGTAGYMSPEQAAGRWDMVGPASDLYGLGATLYELLTGQRPLRGLDLFATLQKTQAGDIPPPRHVQPLVPKALAAICQKAMALKPEMRYASAAALAVDVEHWLADEVVAVYAEPWTLRFRRWLRQHRTSAVGGVVSLIGLVAVLTVAFFYSEAARIEAQRAEKRLDQKRLEAEQNAALAQNNEQKAKDALRDRNLVNKFYQEELIAAARIKGESGGKGYDILLKDAYIAAEPRLSQLFRNNPLLEAEMRHELGVTFRFLLDFERAKTQLLRAIALRRQYGGDHDPELFVSQNSLGVVLQAAHQDVAAERYFRSLYADALAKLGPHHSVTLSIRANLAFTSHHLGKHAEAERHLRDLVQVLEKAPTSGLGLTHTRHCLANLLADLGRTTEAYRLFQQILVGLAEENRYGIEFITAKNNLATLLAQMHREQEAEKLYREVLALEEALLPGNHPNLLITQFNLAATLRRLGHATDAEERFRQLLPKLEKCFGSNHYDVLLTKIHLREMAALAHANQQSQAKFAPQLATLEQRLVKEPANPQLRREAAALWKAYGDTLEREPGNQAEALKAVQKVLEQLEWLMKDQPHNPRTRWEFAERLIHQGRKLGELGHLTEAVAAFDRGLALCQELIQEFPLEAKYLSAKQEWLQHKAETMWHGGEQEAALAVYRLGQEAAEKWEALKQDRFAQERVTRVHLLQGQRLLFLQEPAKALPHLETAQRCAVRLMTQKRGGQQARWLAAECCHTLGVALQRLEDRQRAQGCFEQALNLYILAQPNKNMDQDAPWADKLKWAECQTCLADLLAASGNTAGARTAYEKAIAIIEEQLLKKKAGFLPYTLALARACHQLARWEQEHGNFKAAKSWRERSRIQYEHFLREQPGHPDVSRERDHLRQEAADVLLEL